MPLPHGARMSLSLPVLVGLVALTLAVIAWLAEHRRFRRRDPDAVGCMPWTLLFMVSLLAACVLLGGALRGSW